MACHSLLDKSVAGRPWCRGRPAVTSSGEATCEGANPPGPPRWSGCRARRWPPGGRGWGGGPRPAPAALPGGVAGPCRIAEPCARLGLSEQRFDQLRTQVLQAGLESLEPRRAGRRPRAVPAADVQALRARVAELEIELRAARVREEIALALPAVGVTATEPAKKSPRRRSPARRRRPPQT